MSKGNGATKDFVTIVSYPTELLAIRVSTALSVLSFFLVLILGAFFAELKTDQELSDQLIQQNNTLLKDLVTHLKSKEDEE